VLEGRAYRMGIQVLAILALATLALPTVICAASQHARIVKNQPVTGPGNYGPSQAMNAGELSIQATHLAVGRF
jgi:hypothetical protein